MKFDYSFLDVDYTIFNTGKFEDEIWAVFSSRDVTRKDYEETYKQSLCTVSREEFDYNFQEHVDFLKKREYKLGLDVVEELNKLMEKNHLFSDSIDFIKFLKENRLEMCLIW